ncbi:MAG: DMT family transporter [Planctomycetes bacterium]|nr:DMT family transporter [Planctomycetota bacterium]
MRRGFGDEARDELARARWLALGASLSFSGMYVCVKLLSPQVSSFEALFVRSVIGLSLCLGLLRSAQSPLRWGAWKLNLVRATFGLLSIGGQFVALHEGGCSLSTVAFLRHGAPVWMLLFVGPLLQEWPDRRAKLAVAIGVVGTLLALAPQGGESAWGLAIALSSGFTAALALISVRRLTSTDHPLTVVTFFMGFVALVTGPIVVVRWASAAPQWTARDALLLGIAALLGTVGQLLNTHAYRHGRAVAMAVTGLSEVVFTLLLAWTIAGDALPPWTTFVGGGAILAAAWIATRPRGLPDAAA